MIRIALMVYARGDGEEAKDTVIEIDAGTQRRWLSLQNSDLPLAIVFSAMYIATIGVTKCDIQ